jgi:nitrogen-specific signal transduction histidine kinase
VAVDLTEHLQFERLRRDAGKALQAQKLESLGVLAGGIAHEFNNILTGILGNASLAREHRGDPAALDECLRAVEQSALRAAELCQQMLAFAGRGQVAAEVTDLNRLASEMVTLLTAATRKTATLRLDLAANLPPVRCDAAQVRQVLMNLVTNASDAIGDRDGVVTVSTGVIDADRADPDGPGDGPEPGRYVALAVADTGHGMTDEVRAKAFDPFFTTKFAGRGLGLAAVQGIVRGHGGAIRVASRPGEGSTFTVLLPAAEERPPRPVPEPPAAPGRQRLVLVVEDEENIRTFARKVLELAGFVVELAADGRAGVEAFRARPDAFAAVLLDLTMPHLDGTAVVRELRQLRPDVRVVLMSGYVAPDESARFAGLGLAGFVPKPFRVQDLLKAITDAIGP